MRIKADFLFYGGAAGGGKTDLLIGLALTNHRKTGFFRRQYKELGPIIERFYAILGHRRGLNAQQGVWRIPDRFIEFGSCQHLGDERAFQGHDHDLKAFDEITHFLEAQFRFLCGWNRTTMQNQRCRVVAAGNPPTSAEGYWVVKFWAPWLDENHPNPALPGELRWFATIDGEDVEVGGPEPFAHGGELIEPKSRTFIPSSVEDNPFLMSTGYRAMLQALPEPLRSQMLKGDFSAGQEDDPWQVIPSQWVKAAQERWEPRPRKGTMDALGVDPARGGRDETVLVPRYGEWFDELKVFPGAETPDGPAVASMVVSVLRDAAPVQIDVVGIGAAVYDHLAGNQVHAVAMNGAEKSTANDRSGKLAFFNKRAEWWWRMREDLDPEDGAGLALPNDRALLADLCAPRWKLTQRGIQVEAKEDIVKRLGRSPDRGDAVVYANQCFTKKTAKHNQPAKAESEYDIHGW